MVPYPPGDFGFTGVGGVSCRSSCGNGSALGGNGGEPFMPSPRGDAGTVT